MSDLIETIREKIHNSVGTGFCHALNCKPADEKCKCCEHPAMMQCSNEILDEEAAKEPQKCDSDCISRKKLIEDLDKLTHPTGNECEHMLYKNDVIKAGV